MAERPIAVPGGAVVARLRRGFHGQVVLPGQEGYHTARRVWNAMVDHRPAVIAGCADTADVAAAVGFGRAGPGHRRALRRPQRPWAGGA
jgi:hypothetical protein